MSEEFIVTEEQYSGRNGDEFAVHVYDNDEFAVQVYDNNEDKSSEVIDLECIVGNIANDSNFGKTYVESIIRWMNYHMPFDGKIYTIEGDLRSGVRLGHLLTSITQDLDFHMPYPKPGTEREKKDNNYSITSYVFSREDFDQETVMELVDAIYEGDLGSILHLVLSLARVDVIDNICDPVEEKFGLEQLEFWMQEKVGMTGNLFCYDVSTTNIEEPENLLKLLKYCKFDVPNDYNLLSKTKEKTQYCQELIEKETGIPCLLNSDIDLETEDPVAISWYMFMRYLWIAEVYISCINSRSTEHKFRQQERETTRPKDIVVNAIESSYNQELNLNKLEDMCHVLFDWIQSKIDLFKKEISTIDVGMNSGTRNLMFLTDLYKIMNEEQNEYSKMKLRCYELHCKIQRSLKNEDRDPIKYHPTYNIHKIEDQWNRLIEIESRVEQKMQSFIAHAENRNTLYVQWERELNKVHQWMNRWTRYFTSIEQTLQFNTVDSRKSLKAVGHDLINEVEENNHSESIRLLARILIDFTMDTDDQEFIQKKTDQVCEEFEQFVCDSQGIAEKIEEKQQAGSDVEVMYSEMADLLNKLDEQIHDLYQYYILRPRCTTISSCDKLNQYLKDTWRSLFEISYELDAVASLEEDIKKMTAGTPTKNYLTGVTPKYARQRWEALLLEASYLEEYTQQQRRRCLQQKPAVDEFNSKLGNAVAFVASKMVEITGAIRKDDMSLSHMIRSELTDTLDELYMKDLNKVAETLPDSPLVEDAFHKILELRECVSYAVATVDLVMSDTETCLSLEREREIDTADMALYKGELRSFCSLHYQLLPTLASILKILPTEKDRETLSVFASTVDPLYSRVTLSAWLNFNRPDCYSNVVIIEKELRESFQMLSGNDKYIKESTFRDSIMDENVLHYGLQHVTEYLGGEYKAEDNGGEKAWDYNRFIANLVGKHKKLLIEPEY